MIVVAAAIGFCAGRRWYVSAGLLLILLALASAVHAEVPARAHQYKHALTREAMRVWGLDAPVARLAAQIHQESAWNADAKSRYASGLAQFTPDTAAWIVAAYPKDFDGVVAPYSPAWALRAVARYDRHLYDRTRGHTECDRWWLTLRKYNGGAGHIAAEARNAVDPLDRAAVDAVCGTARRSVKHCAENLGYPRKILLRWEPMYYDAGWGWVKPTCQPGGDAADTSPCGSPYSLSAPADIEARLQGILDGVNAEFQYVAETGDVWLSPEELRASGGDCEDFAIAYWQRIKLARLPGVPRLAYLATRPPHMVTVYHAPGQSWVLDVLADAVYPLDKAPGKVVVEYGVDAIGKPVGCIGSAAVLAPDKWLGLFYGGR
jgi:predicted transglutaminase-like cysteine proteinase